MEQKLDEMIASSIKKFKQSQIKAYEKVNAVMCTFFLDFGKELFHSDCKITLGKIFYRIVSDTMCFKSSSSSLFSISNLHYIESFYCLFGQYVSENTTAIDKLALVAWEYHKVIIDNVSNTEEALFFVDEMINHNFSLEEFKEFIKNKKASSTQR